MSKSMSRANFEVFYLLSSSLDKVTKRERLLMVEQESKWHNSSVDLTYIGTCHVPVNRPPFFSLAYTQWPPFNKPTPTDPLFSNFSLNDPKFSWFCTILLHVRPKYAQLLAILVQKIAIFRMLSVQLSINNTFEAHDDTILELGPVHHCELPPFDHSAHWMTLPFSTLHTKWPFCFSRNPILIAPLVCSGGRHRYVTYLSAPNPPSPGRSMYLNGIQVSSEDVWPWL